MGRIVKTLHFYIFYFTFVHGTRSFKSVLQASCFYQKKYLLLNLQPMLHRFLPEPLSISHSILPASLFRMYNFVLSSAVFPLIRELFPCVTR